MRFEELLAWLGNQPFFDLAAVMQVSRESRHNVRVQLHRWIQQGRLIPLRRGLYAWGEKFRKAPLSLPKLANEIYRPSYLSGLWALGFYGMIPERVVTFTSVTTRSPRMFENPLGVFDYRHVKMAAFFGYRTIKMDGVNVRVAWPEKALLDFFYLSRGDWTKERMEEMRFQNMEIVRVRRLDAFARKFNSERLVRIVELWRETAAEEGRGFGKL